ncbi:MAG: hypothetical protein QXP60_07085 [Nitrososphaerota archaeon]
MKVLVEQKKTLKEAFKELWLKYTDYDKCIKELKKIGFKTTKGYLKTLRIYLKLPKMYELIIKNKKCIICGKKAEVIFGFKHGKYSPKTFTLLCKKCYYKEYSKTFRKINPNYAKIRCKRYYKEHKIEILKKLKAVHKQISIYLGEIDCPICLKHGSLYAHFIKRLSTKHVTGPWFLVNHQYYINGKKHVVSCYIGRNKNLERRISPYLLECNCKKCRLKRGKTNESIVKERI